MNLHPFEVKLTRTVDRREEYKILTIWVATHKAAQEAATLFAKEEGWPDAAFTIRAIPD